MNTVIFDHVSRTDLLPLTYTRPVGYLRVGILTIKEKWEHYLNTDVSCLSENYLRKKFEPKIEEDNLFINSSILPNKDIIKEILNLAYGQLLVRKDIPIAGIIKRVEIDNIIFSESDKFKTVEANSDFNQVSYPWDIFSLNGEEIENDYKLLTENKTSQKIPDTVNAVEKERIFLEDGAKIQFINLDPKSGYIYLGKNTEIMDGVNIRGSLALCENSVIKMGAKIYGPTTIGPFSKVGGEITNSVIIGNSNKGHEGYLGNSVLGEWCNIGADTNNSNLKNNYAEVKLWNYRKNGFQRSGLQFCGLIMGDHSKCGINTMFNTGTVVGVSANIFGSGFPRNFIPSFSWGGASGFTTYKLNKAFETAELVMKRRGIELDDIEKAILEEIFKQTEQYRTN